ncbi:hypothetical protein BLJAPNOD_06428 [Ensifer sp. M14]|uniref:alpha/beta hydrolase n=1 Tax=Ensifer sp. M14 TaxID=2203782 RepID=UPI000E1D7289|nr:alpha/beta hydrolase [Ensifer sp. M14]RDL46769.1 hypothetical protein BLJAPNOD_06428 [Ensifer sp. M14]
MRFVVGTIAFFGAVLLPFNLDLVKFPIVQALSSTCYPPENPASNAGQLVSLDLRSPEAKTGFVLGSPKEWANAQADSLTPLQTGKGHLIVYVHGFRTSMRNATCAAKAVAFDLARREAAADSVNPDVLVFGWPGETEAQHFSRAQSAALQAAGYLAELLWRLRDREIVLIGHSLGASVVMDAVSQLPLANDADISFRALILIQAAIPIASLRTWSYKITSRNPAAEIHDRIAGRKPPDPYVEEGTGTGCYVVAALKAQDLIVTYSKDDITLSRMYATDEIFLPGRCQGPRLLPVEGKPVRSLPQTVAVGLGIAKAQNVGIHRLPMPPSPSDYADRFREKEDWDKPSLRPPDDSQVRFELTEAYDFRIAHPSYHELDLEQMPGWRFLFDYHSPLNHPTMRAYVLDQIWRILEEHEPSDTRRGQ